MVYNKYTISAINPQGTQALKYSQISVVWYFSLYHVNYNSVEYGNHLLMYLFMYRIILICISVYFYFFIQFFACYYFVVIVFWF